MVLVNYLGGVGDGLGVGMFVKPSTYFFLAISRSIDGLKDWVVGKGKADLSAGGVAVIFLLIAKIPKGSANIAKVRLNLTFLTKRSSFVCREGLLSILKVYCDLI